MRGEERKNHNNVIHLFLFLLLVMSFIPAPQVEATHVAPDSPLPYFATASFYFEFLDGEIRQEESFGDVTFELGIVPYQDSAGVTHTTLIEPLNFNIFSTRDNDILDGSGVPQSAHTPGFDGSTGVPGGASRDIEVKTVRFTFPAGVQNHTFTFPDVIVDDTQGHNSTAGSAVEYEENQTFVLTGTGVTGFFGQINTPTGGIPTQSGANLTVVIIDNDQAETSPAYTTFGGAASPEVSLSPNTQTVYEGDVAVITAELEYIFSGDTVFEIDVNQPGQTSAALITTDFTIRDRTSNNLPFQKTIRRGEAHLNIFANIIDDATEETEESLILSTNHTDGTITQATVIIPANLAVPQRILNVLEDTEVDESDGQIDITLAIQELTGTDSQGNPQYETITGSQASQLGAAIPVDFSIQENPRFTRQGISINDPPAFIPADFDLSNPSGHVLSFNQNDLTGQISISTTESAALIETDLAISIVDDPIVERNETFGIVFSSPNNLFPSQLALVTINSDDEPLFRFVTF